MIRSAQPRQRPIPGVHLIVACVMAAASIVVPATGVGALDTRSGDVGRAGTGQADPVQADPVQADPVQPGTRRPGSGADPSEPQEPFLCTTEYNGLGQPTVDNQDREGTPVYPESAPDTADREQDPIGWSKRCQADERVEYRYRDTAGEVQTLPAGATELPSDIAYLDTAEMIGVQDTDLGDADLGDAERIPYLYRYQRATLPENRFIYSIAMLVPFEEVTAAPQDDLTGDGGTDDGDTDDGGAEDRGTEDRGTEDSGTEDGGDSYWNGRLVYSFGGGVGIGHSQGSLSDGDSQLDEALRAGHAVVYSSGTRTSVHYNLLLGGRVATELKDLFIDQYGEPLYTVGIGGSGGAIQQYVYAQNHPDLLDALIPQYSYPDMTTQTINVGDCELLEYYMDVTDGDNPRWRDWDNRKILEGQNTIEGFESDWQEVTGATGSSECIEGWRGATPLALNPTFGLAADMDEVILPYAGELLERAGAGEPAIPDDFPDLGRLLRQSEDPDEWVSWTHWDDVAEAYGIDPETGFARSPWDNVGVQYGLRAIAKGQITPEEFLELNERIGSWKPARQAVPESCGMVTEMAGETLGAFASAIGMCEGDELDQYSSRQMREPSGDAPVPRTEGDVQAITNAFESGLEFDGRLGRDVPILDVRHYLEEELDMHNVHQSFVVRSRIERTMGDADNQVIWFMDARPEEDEEATSERLTDVYRLMDDWVLAMRTGDTSAAEAKPAEAVDACFDTAGAQIASGADVWDGAVELAVTGEGAWTDEAPTEVEAGEGGSVEVGECAARFPINSTSRVVAGGPITNDVFKCHRKPVGDSVADGDYGGWSPTDEQRQRLEEIFPDGVCDYSLRSVGYPFEEVAPDDAPVDQLDAVEATAVPRPPSTGLSPGWLAVAGLGAVALLLGAAVTLGRMPQPPTATGRHGD